MKKTFYPSNINMQRSGFALPIVIVTASMMILVLLALLQAIVSMRSVIEYSFYSKTAELSAEAGTVYALACYEADNREQRWGGTPSTLYLTQSADCNGNPNAFNASTINGVNASIPIRFSVGAMSITPSSVNIPASGTAQRPGFSAPVTGTTSRSVTYRTDLNSQKSTSGTNRTCAILSGDVYCWGYNAFGQLGNGQYLGTGDIEEASSIDSNVPVKVKKNFGVLSGKIVVDIFTAQYHSCALTSDGKMYCWGYNSQGQLGNGSTTSNGTPYEVTGPLAGKTVTAIGGTSNTSCAIAEGKIYCWGSNINGLVGINSSTNGANYSSPRLVTAGNTSSTLPTNYTATGLSTSGSRSRTMCAIAGGKAYCWGENSVGSVGDGTTTQRNLPTKVVDSGVLSGKTVTALSQDGYISTASGGFAHVCALASGAVYCWGSNTSGQLGRGTATNVRTADSSSPIAVYTGGVLGGKTVTAIAVGLRHSCALASNEVYCWGGSSSGQVGNNSTATQYVPVKVHQESGILLGATILQIGAGANRGCAVTGNGRTYCWGLNTSGQIGDGTYTNRLKPTESFFLRPKNDEFIY